MNRPSLLCLQWTHTEKQCERASLLDYVITVFTTLRKLDRLTHKLEDVKASVCRKKNSKYQVVEINV